MKKTIIEDGVESGLSEKVKSSGLVFYFFGGIKKLKEGLYEPERSKYCL